jgi:hypothetical protein
MRLCLIKKTFFFSLFLFSLCGQNLQDLENMFLEWRSFEKPSFNNGVPDYSKKAFNSKQREFLSIKKRVINFDTSFLDKDGILDWKILVAEINGYDFNYRVLKPWERDPGFYRVLWNYQSDVPDHEGPTNHATLELWIYSFPLDQKSAKEVELKLRAIGPFLKQAKTNLVGNARDLWMGGIQIMKNQSRDLSSLSKKINKDSQPDLYSAISQAIIDTDNFVVWLEKELPKKNGPSGVGKENYTWYQQNVHLLPFSWDEEVFLLERELFRAWNNLALEEVNNSMLPKIVAANSEEEFKQLSELGVQRLMGFLKEKNILTVKNNMEPELRKHMGSFVPESERNFFIIGLHLDPVPLYSHFYHWFELAEMRDNPHKRTIRRSPLLYNIFDSKNEGIATAVEEVFMNAGIYNDSPRSKEIVWIMLAQRAARGLGSLYAHANLMSMEEAGRVHVTWTPRGWMEREESLLKFEQLLYLRQPGYGTSYITGKIIFEQILSEYKKECESTGVKFEMSKFMDLISATGNIPISLVYESMINNQKISVKGLRNL